MKKLIITALLCNAACGTPLAFNVNPTAVVQTTLPVVDEVSATQVVQFCAGANTAYPGTFAEVGFCINNNLYAVYSANDGFLTLVPPGTYSSNGINASCTFTVLPNCVVSQ